MTNLQEHFLKKAPITLNENEREAVEYFAECVEKASHSGAEGLAMVVKAEFGPAVYATLLAGLTAIDEGLVSFENSK